MSVTGEFRRAPSLSCVHRIVTRELAGGARRREVLADDAFVLWQERTEALLNAHWDQALGGDVRSAELCRKLLGQQARMCEVGVDAVIPLPASTPTAAFDDVDDEHQDRMSQMRFTRAGPQQPHR